MLSMPNRPFEPRAYLRNGGSARHLPVIHRVAAFVRIEAHQMMRRLFFVHHAQDELMYICRRQQLRPRSEQVHTIFTPSFHELGWEEKKKRERDKSKWQ